MVGATSSEDFLVIFTSTKRRGNEIGSAFVVFLLCTHFHEILSSCNLLVR